MKILFKKPIVSTQEKEKEFLLALAKVPAYLSVEEMGGHFLLALDNNLGIATIQQLFVLFEHWHIDKSPLESFNQLVNQYQ
ncbi:MAG: hypothetical protein KBT50_06290 [Cycloclasticus sp.]|nr:hypothetical protein [Cycloclasticus sp.]MBQ0790212.1 hypothetical protein [Cycloclasticus sp.]